MRLRRSKLLKWTLLTVFVLSLLWLVSKRVVGRSETNDSNWSWDFDDNADVAIPLKSGPKQREYIDSKGLHVVVGRYVGNAVPGEASVNLTDDLLNANNFAPIQGQGDMGEAVLLSPREDRVAQQLYQIHRFNIYISDRIPLDRRLPDIRKHSCRDLTYDTKILPSTSVIIVFHNEAWSTLLRTVHSVINRSPKNLVKEILLIDDASTRKYLQQELDVYVEKLEVPTRVIRSKERVGLIKARLLGANKATGDVLTFLDAHCETTPGWLEPLLYRIQQNRTSVVCPIIDIISDDTFALLRSFELHFGGVSWNLHFRWFASSDQLMQERKQNITTPFRTPVMAGGLFAIDRHYFNEIGAYDEQMDIWGGENIELSFRVWQCGGRVEIAPCSHVGHVFRKSSPYTFPREGGVNRVLNANLARVALVWMDQWQHFFFKLSPEASRLKDTQMVRSRLSLRTQLQCKSFDWYLKNVWPENFFPAPGRFFGRVRHLQSDKCLQRPLFGQTGSSQPVGVLKLAECLKGTETAQLWVGSWNESSGGFLMSDESICVDNLNGEARAMACTGLGRQLWSYDAKKRTIQHESTGHCLTLARPPEPAGVAVHECDKSYDQQWVLDPVPWV